MKWIKGDSLPTLAMQDADLDRAMPLFAEARRMWAHDGQHVEGRGSAVIGAGIGVMYIPPRCRNPRERVVVECPFQTDGAITVWRPLLFLARHGIPAFHVYGRLD